MASEIVCAHCGTVNPAQENFCDECGAALNASQVASPPLLKQRYRVLNKLGAGGFGAVYKVADTGLHNRFLAAKKLNLDTIAPVDQQTAIESFKHEAHILADLIHPNLPRIYEYFVDNGDYYLVMDFIEGETLSDYLEKQASSVIPVIAVINMSLQLTTVLDYLHTRQPPIIFRDLKPENMMVTPKGEVYLIDFGIARRFKPGQAGDTVRWGTLEYAAPEQLRGEQTSALSDMYSLGVVLHQMLSGDAPTLPHRFGPLKFPGKPQTALANLVMSMLEHDPQHRPASAAEVKRKLQQILQDLQNPTKASNAQGQSAAPNAKKAYPAPPKPAKKPQVPAPPPQPRTQGELCHSYTHASKKINALAWSSDGKSLAAAGEEPDEIYLWQALTQQAPSTYKVHTRRVQALAWSPTSRLLVSGGNDRVARVWRPGHGAQKEYTGHMHWVQAAAWSPDGQTIASGSADGQVHLWDAATCQRKLVYRGHTSDVLALAFAPDGTRVASADASGSIQVWEAASGKLLTTYTEHRKSVNALAWSPDGQQIVSGSLDWTVHVWQAQSGQQMTLYAKHSRMVTAVAWSVTTNRIASTGKDQSVQIWQPQTGDTLYTYRGHTSTVNALAWSPDGNYLASAGESDVVHVWWTL